MIKIQSSYDYDDLIISGEKSLFGPGNAKLPLPSLILSRIFGFLIAILKATPSCPDV